ncbi:MAG: hypothetical protein K0S65_2370, partial [Labilithrix sp.]|nr:hypothetical protein [Labilithrix sp.]
RSARPHRTHVRDRGVSARVTGSRRRCRSLVSSLAVLRSAANVDAVRATLLQAAGAGITTVGVRLAQLGPAVVPALEGALGARVAAAGPVPSTEPEATTLRDDAGAVRRLIAFEREVFIVALVLRRARRARAAVTEAAAVRGARTEATSITLGSSTRDLARVRRRGIAARRRCSISARVRRTATGTARPAGTARAAGSTRTIGVRRGAVLSGAGGHLVTSAATKRSGKPPTDETTRSHEQSNTSHGRSSLRQRPPRLASPRRARSHDCALPWNDKPTFDRARGWSVDRPRARAPAHRSPSQNAYRNDRPPSRASGESVPAPSFANPCAVLKPALSPSAK